MLLARESASAAAAAAVREGRSDQPARVSLRLLLSRWLPEYLGRLRLLLLQWLLEYRGQLAPISPGDDNRQRALAAVSSPAAPDNFRCLSRSRPPASRANLCSRSICSHRPRSGTHIRSEPPALSSGATPRTVRVLYRRRTHGADREPNDRCTPRAPCFAHPRNCRAAC